MHFTLNDLSTLLAILLGSGAIGSGTWKAALAILRKAQASQRRAMAAEQLTEHVVTMLAAHHQWIGTHAQQHQEEHAQWNSNPPPPPPSTPSPSDDMRARLPGTPSR